MLDRKTGKSNKVVIKASKKKSGDRCFCMCMRQSGEREKNTEMIMYN